MRVGVLDLFFELRDVHPVVIYNVFDELLFAFVLPEEGRVCPFVFRAVFGHLVADLVEVVYDLGGIFLDVGVVADLVVEIAFQGLDLFFLDCLAVWVFLFLHAGQHLFSPLLVDFVHFVLDFWEPADNIINGADDFSDGL